MHLTILEKICRLARYTGSIIMNFYHSDQLINITYKSDHTPITNVDREANNIIKKGLMQITPQYPIISEEDSYDFKICGDWENYWLIDPLDGTKEFLKKNGEFTVNISLIKNGIPIIGVIYAPFFNVLYYSFNNTAWKETKLGIKEKIHVLNSVNQIPLLITSASHPDQKLEHYLKKIKKYKLKKMGSSLKFCLIAEGTAQIYPRFGNTHIWDTAAGQSIILAAGGKIQTWTGEQLNYSLLSRSSFTIH